VADTVTPALLQIVVADRHDGFRRALVAVLAEDPRLIVLQATDLRAAGSTVRRRRAAVLVVDVALFESDRAALGPIPAGTRIVAVGMDDSKARERRALAAGADAYVVKDRAHTALAAVLLADA
jgi:DNA-binding NarL/FixJ family response regulator